MKCEEGKRGGEFWAAHIQVRETKIDSHRPILRSMRGEMEMSASDAAGEAKIEKHVTSCRKSRSRS